MNPTRSFKEVIAWQKAHQFVLKVYTFSSAFPREEMYGLTSQLRRAAVSAAANIAEGYVKASNKDKRRFFNMAQASLEECRYYLILAMDLEFNHDASLDMLIEEVSKVLNSYVRSISTT